MKKLTSIALAALMVLALAATLTGCGNDDADSLVGTWDGDDVVMVINGNGSGEMIEEWDGETFRDAFTWSVDGDEFTMIMDGQTIAGEFTLSGNRLTITTQFGTETFTRRQSLK